MIDADSDETDEQFQGRIRDRAELEARRRSLASRIAACLLDAELGELVDMIADSSEDWLLDELHEVNYLRNPARYAQSDEEIAALAAAGDPAPPPPGAPPPSAAPPSEPEIGSLTESEGIAFRAEYLALLKVRDDAGDSYGTQPLECAICHHRWVSWPKSTCPKKGRHPPTRDELARSAVGVSGAADVNLDRLSELLTPLGYEWTIKHGLLDIHKRRG